MVFIKQIDLLDLDIIFDNMFQTCLKNDKLISEKLPKPCLHSRVPGGFSSDPVRGSMGFRQVCARHVCMLFTVLRPCRLRHSAAKWSPMASNREKHNGYQLCSGLSPLWAHLALHALQMPPRCSPDGPQMAPHASYPLTPIP